MKTPQIKTIKYARMLISICTEFCLGKMDREYFLNIMEISVKTMLEEPENSDYKKVEWLDATHPTGVAESPPPFKK